MSAKNAVKGVGIGLLLIVAIIVVVSLLAIVGGAVGAAVAYLYNIILGAGLDLYLSAFIGSIVALMGGGSAST